MYSICDSDLTTWGMLISGHHALATISVERVIFSIFFLLLNLYFSRFFNYDSGIKLYMCEYFHKAQICYIFLSSPKT